jgi:hypothetical protein
VVEARYDEKKKRKKEKKRLQAAETEAHKLGTQ